MKNSGLAIHCRHNILVEPCYDYKGRVRIIKRDKPLSEQEIRIRLFKILPDEALRDIPVKWQEALQKRQEAEQEREKALQKWEKAEQKWEEAFLKWEEANQKWQEAKQQWSQADKDAFHKRWCGCSEWNGTEIVFKEA